ncbi:hypothetical protein CK203_085586 [Vitis vinifera]|uniref:Retrovirus-related Pol polyprotein from transposon TNT 1-94 n=1 Tax=Vitis vinifera TaxID=29760 RepID=A0A438BWH9_VITVI|nr:hypothetical protein CK203_085586 [Vitis vinifera]
MAKEAGKDSGIEKFDGTDFAYWRMQIEDYLYGKKLHMPFLGIKPEKIDFDDEIRALVVLGSLPNNWGTIRMAVSNSTEKEKLKYNDIQDLILVEEIRRRDVGETSESGSALNLETRGRSHFRRQCKSPKKKNEDDSANAVTEEVQDALLLAVDSPLDDWVLDSGASFHTTPH